MARRDPIGIRLLTRNGHDWAPRYPLIVAAMGRLKVRSCLIDGEAVACDENGLAVFERLRHKRSGEHVFLYAFDLLELDGHDLRREPLETRKATLASLLRGSLLGAASERAPRPRWRERIPARLQDGPRRHRVEASRLALPFRPLARLVEVQEPGCASGETRGRRRVGLNRSGSALMANDEHVALLRQGVAAWNAWRDENPNIHPDLSEAYLSEANLGGANLGGADLQAAILIDTDFSGADLTGCRIYGVSAWSLKLEGAKQQNLVITGHDEPAITVDNIEVAQFIYLLLNNQKVRDVIDTITSKAVLILGRFTQERKPVLEALREELRQRKYLPILFDFEKPRSRNTDETITLLARMARFVVADISDAKSVLQELRAIVPDLPSVPVQPIILAMQEEPGMFDFYRNFRSFLNVHRYASQEQLIADLGEKVIRPAELKVLDLQGST